MSDGLFPGFTRQVVRVGDVDVNLVTGGSGPALLLLHGWPQTHAMWHELAPRLASHFTVVASDLRGYGDSGKPESGPDHAAYSFRAMAADQVAVMAALGHPRFAVVGHDRGARVTHRMLLDSPEAVTRAALLDIVPTAYVYEHADQELARAYFHWFFLIQQAPLPEMMIGPVAPLFLRAVLGAFGGADFYAPAAMAEYERCFTPETIHAMCEDYRAAASIDLEHDGADAGRRVTRPVLVLWGSRGVVGRLYDVPAVWSGFADDLTCAAVEAGHFLVEERPDDVLGLLEGFLAE